MSAAWECPGCGVRIVLEEPPAKRLRRRWWRRVPILRLSVPDAWLADVAAHTWTCGGRR